jgi:exonuclease III
VDLDRTTISVASLNVGGVHRGFPPLTARAPVFGRWFSEHDVDVINFQEVWTRGRLAVLRSALPSYPYVAWRRGAGHPAGGLATFSRLPVTGVSYTAFRGMGPDSGGRLFRLLLAVNSRLQGVLTVDLATRTGESAVVANTHLTANRDGDWSAGNRHRGLQRAQLDAFHRVLAGVVAPVVVAGGDLNIASGSGHDIVRPGWRDPFQEADRPTFHAAFLPPGRPTRRIDHLLVRGAPVLAATVLFVDPSQVGGGTALLSDHCGLLVRLGVS